MNVVVKAWEKLSRSEKSLIASAAVLGIALGSWQFMIRPVLAAASNTQLQYETAIRDYDIVARALPRMPKSAAGADSRAPFARAALIDTARAVNITISRVQPAADNSLQVWFEDTSSRQIYSFLQTLERGYAAELLSVQINRKEGGLVSAQLKLAPIGGAGL